MNKSQRGRRELGKLSVTEQRRKDRRKRVAISVLKVAKRSRKMKIEKCLVDLM